MYGLIADTIFTFAQNEHRPAHSCAGFLVKYRYVCYGRYLISLIKHTYMSDDIIKKEDEVVVEGAEMATTPEMDATEEAAEVAATEESTEATEEAAA